MFLNRRLGWNAWGRTWNFNTIYPDPASCMVIFSSLAQQQQGVAFIWGVAPRVTLSAAAAITVPIL